MVTCEIMMCFSAYVRLACIHPARQNRFPNTARCVQKKVMSSDLQIHDDFHSWVQLSRYLELNFMFVCRWSCEVFQCSRVSTGLKLPRCKVSEAYFDRPSEFAQRCCHSCFIDEKRGLWANRCTWVHVCSGKSALWCWNWIKPAYWKCVGGFEALDLLIFSGTQFAVRTALIFVLWF